MLGPQITQRMAELGIDTHTELAKRSGLSVGYVNDLIHGKRGKRLGYHTAQKLARALRVKPIFFATDSADAGKSESNHAAAESEGVILASPE